MREKERERESRTISSQGENQESWLRFDKEDSGEKVNQKKTPKNMSHKGRERERVTEKEREKRREEREREQMIQVAVGIIIPWLTINCETVFFSSSFFPSSSFSTFLLLLLSAFGCLFSHSLSFSLTKPFALIHLLFQGDLSLLLRTQRERERGKI